MTRYAKALCKDCAWIVYVEDKPKDIVVCHYTPEPLEIDPELDHCSNYEPRRGVEFDARPRLLPKT